MAKFAHLHCHSEYSRLDGGSKIEDMPEVLKELGFEHMALTDHGVMQGLPFFHDALKDAGIKPILGLEAYMTEDRHVKDKESPTWHMTLLSENDIGYSNLCKISSYAYLEGRYKKPRADWDLFSRYSEGIICLTGCMAGPVMGEIMGRGRLSLAKERTERLIEIFGADNVYGEIQNVGISKGIPGDSEVAKALNKEPLTAEEAALASTDKDVVEAGQVSLSQTEANRILVEYICKPLGIKYVGTGDVHYLREDDADPHDTMLCIGTKQLKTGQRKFSLLPNHYHLRSYDEMLAALPEWPEALAETVVVADRCDVTIEYGRELLPRYPIPEDEGDSSEYLEKLCQQGLADLYPQGNPYRQDASERLQVELGVIGSMGFNDYFLIVWDLFREARERDIPYGPGRGSAAGSIVAYCLGITQMCPLKYGLLFERFLNPDRKSMPDIDMDFGVSERETGIPLRDELIKYSVDKYNGEAGCTTAVAQIVTFGKFKAKGALKDSARALSDPTPEGIARGKAAGIRLSGLIPKDPRATIRTVWDDEVEGQGLRNAYKGDQFDKDIIKQAAWLEGLVRTNGTHAAAVIISEVDLMTIAPLQWVNDAKPIELQYDMGIAEALGLLKMDFLGLRTLDVIWDTIKLVKSNRGISIGDPYHDIPLDDEATYKSLSAGESIGIFQFESGGMASTLRQTKPTEFNDLIALVALYRPGAMAHIPSYANRKNGHEETTYLHPDLKDILGETYGICVYQEQNMRIASKLAGFTPGQADDLRKAIGKKLKDKMDILRGPFLDGCRENDISQKDAETLWADNEASADYSFNKAHAACYALIAYITAYLKTNFSEEYEASLMTAVMKDKDKVRTNLTESKRMKLSVLAPDINRSVEDFTVAPVEEGEGYDLLFGLIAINGVNHQTIAELLAEREQRGAFTSMFDLIRRRPKLGGKVVQALAEAGALDNMPGSRKAKSELAEESVDENKKKRRLQEREYVKAIKEWLKAHPNQGDETTSKGARKLTALETAGVNKGAIHFHDNKSEDTVDEVIHEAIRRKLLSEEKRKAKQEMIGLKDSASTDISSEDDEQGDPIQELAEQRAEEQLDLVAAITSAISRDLRKAAAGVAEEQAAQGLAFALEEEQDPILSTDEWPPKEKFLIERNRLGTYVTGHPLDRDRRKWAYYVDQGVGKINSKLIGSNLKIVGAVVEKVERKTRKGELMCNITLEDLTGSRSLTIWPDTYQGIRPLIELGEILVFEVVVKEDAFAASRKAEEAEDDEVVEEDDTPVQLIVGSAYKWDPERIEVPDDVEDAGQRATLTLTGEATPEIIAALQEISSEYPGDARLFIKVGEADPVRTSLLVSREKHVHAELAAYGHVRGIFD